MSREARHYRAIRAVVVGGFAASLLLLWTMATRQYLTLFHRATDCGCAITPLQWSTGMAVGSSVLGLATLYLTIRFLVEIGLRVRRHRTLTIGWLARGRVVWNHAVQMPVTVVTDQDAQAMTVGLWRPRIVVTTGLIHRLSSSEISSVLRHEQAHALARDPLWSVLLESTGATLSWIGGLRQIVNTAFSLREIVADAIATANYTQASGLSGAMYKLATTAKPAMVPAFSPNTDRVTKLLNTAWELPVRWWSWRTVVAGLVVAIGLWFASGLPQATAAAQPMLPNEACWLRQVMCAQPPTEIILMTPDSAMSKYGW